MASMIRRIFKFGPFHIAILAVFAGIIAYFIGIPFLDLMELKTIDLRFESRGTLPPEGKVVLAVVDEKSIGQEGKWVWPRYKFADLIDRLSAAGAKVVAFDIGFLEPDNKQLTTTIEDIQQTLKPHIGQNPEIDSYLQRIRRESDNDRRLAEAFQHSSAKVVLGYFFHTEQEEAKHIGQRDLAVNKENLRGAEYKMVRYTSRAAKQVPLIEAFSPESNISVIAESTPYAGFFSMKPDPDGAVRRMPSVIKFDDVMYAPLALMAVSAREEKPI